MFSKLPKIHGFILIYFYVLSTLQLSNGSSWVYQNDVEVKVCYNPNNNIGFCVPTGECAAFNFVVRHNLRENYQFFWASRCVRETGNPPFICCTNDIQFKERKLQKNRKDRIIFPDECDKTTKKPDKTANLKDVQPIESTTNNPIIATTDISVVKEHEKGEGFPKPPNCGNIVIANKIYGGKDADLTEFSWMVILEYRNQTTGEVVMDCAGSLINNRYVLTAAHCVQGAIIQSKGILESVRIGEHDTKSETDCDETGCRPPFQRIAVESIIPHPDFKPKSYEGIRNHHDIALLRLKEAVKFDTNLQPVCLPSGLRTKELEESTKLVVAGWGHNGTMVRTAIKQKLELPLIKHEKCSEIFGKKLYLADEQLCAGGRYREDSCNGDSGGPLMLIEKDYWILEGIVSFGLKCGLEQPGVYTNVRHYIQWIEENVKN